MTKKIRSITVNRFDYLVRNVNDEEPGLHGHLSHLQEFDIEGRILKDVKYDKSGILEEMYEFFYGESGRLEAEHYFEDEQEPVEKKSFVYNEAGELTTIFKHYFDGSVDTTVCRYNETGQLIEKVVTNDEGETEQIERFEWAEGRPILEEVSDGNGTPMSRRTTVYDQQGKIVTTATWDGNADVELTIVNEYDETGSLTGIKRLDNEGDLLEATLFQVDEDGNRVAVSESAYQPDVQSQVTYNKLDLPVKEEEVTKAGDVLSRIERTYNSEGRETETEVYINGQGQQVSRHYYLKYEYDYFES